MDVVVGERGLLAYDYGWLVAWLSSSVFKLGSMVDQAQDPDYGFWPGHRVNLNFFFNQNDIVLVKNKKVVNGLQSDLIESTLQVSRVFNHLYFFTNSTQF